LFYGLSEPATDATQREEGQGRASGQIQRLCDRNQPEIDCRLQPRALRYLSHELEKSRRNWRRWKCPGDQIDQMAAAWIALRIEGVPKAGQ